MKFVKVQAYEITGDEIIQGLAVLYEDKEGKHEITAEGKNEKECLLNLLNMVVKLGRE